MLNDQVIVAIATAITANANAIQSLLDHLPVEAKEQVAKQVVKTVPNVQSAPTPTVPVTVTPAPMVAAAPTPVMASPSKPVMPPPPVFETAPVAPVPPTLPFHDGATLLVWVMAQYKEMGPEKGKGLQDIMRAMGFTDMHKLESSRYQELFTRVQALKAS